VEIDRLPTGVGAMEDEMQFGTSIRQLSPHELGLLGMADVAYVKPILVDGVAAFAVHAADGSRIAVIPDRDLAFAVVRQNDMEPVSVH
jgi:hypothetical protein